MAITILCLIALGALIYYLKTKNKHSNQKAQNQIGSVSRQTIEELDFFCKSNNFTNTFVNLLIKNKFAKRNFSVIPGVIILPNKIVVLSDFLNTKKANKIEITNQNFNSGFLYFKNKKRVIENFHLTWYKEIERFMRQNFGSVEVVLIHNNSDLEIVNSTKYKLMTLSQLETYINSNASNQGEIRVEQVVNRLENINKFETENKRR
ncbi:hypothetical protein [Mycoplasmoides fastidiosum]|uniref:hypothetical protein n=1 Tax=Mycoplasmoides fastidiosum TaxID=92758 RepID=UPI002113B815|nr:hypothetical protein [Mycoplasmoides fastidiosum]UUD37624.1 hypothetical protein NPA10_03590 [Mycoplasmoides fastidiosum]